MLTRKNFIKKTDISECVFGVGYDRLEEVCDGLGEFLETDYPISRHVMCCL